MLTWEQFEKAAPEMARFGTERLSEHVMYLGTVRKDGSPRVHPFTPFISAGRLFAFIYPTSPKGHDLKRDGRYGIHSQVRDWNGAPGELSISGRARFIEDEETRALALKGCPYTPRAGAYDCFEFLIDECRTTHYVEGKAQYARWNESSASKR